MNQRQERFAELVAGGTAIGKAYRDAGYTQKAGASDSAAHNLLKKTEIRERIDEIRAEARSAAVMSRQQMLEQLSHLARCAEPDGAKIQAMVQLARLEGYEEGGERPSEIIVRFGSPV